MNLSSALQTAQKACAAAREIQLRRFGGALAVNEKGLEGLVSEADLLSEEAIREILTTDFPDIPVFGEEGVYKSHAALPDTSWIVDPLDGTTNYIYGFPVYCISLALQVKGEIVLGVVDVPPWNRQYRATKGEGAFLNEKPIRVSDRETLAEGLLATGFHPGYKDQLPAQIQVFARLVEKSRAVRRAGAAALDLCLVAEGIFDAFWEANLKPWDTAAGSLIVKEAGGVVYNYEGDDFHVLHKSVIASNPKMYPHIKKELA